MADSFVGLLGFVLALALIAFGVPVALSLGFVGLAGYAFLNGVPSALFIIGSGPFEAIFPYSLSVIPLFLMMGVFSSRCGLSKDLFQAANALVGRFRGGLAMATICACAGFGAICGSSLATVATIGHVALPEMRRAGYDDRLSSASIAAGGTLGVMIPPSILLIIYGLLTEQSIGKLFSAAIIPGLLATGLYAACVAISVRLNPKLVGEVPSASESSCWKSLRKAWPVALMFAVVIGGIQAGIFSPTEAAAVGAAGAVLLALGKGSLDRLSLVSAMRETVQLTGMIFFIIIGAALFNFFIETTGMPQYLIATVEESGLPAFSVLLVIILFYLVLGCFMDSMSMIMLTIPFVFPLVSALGFDPIWFGILVVTVAELGLITPPVGMNLFVMQGVARDLNSVTVMRGIVPFILADAVRLVLLIFVPALTLYLPSLL
ncbi:TRAP transporter large permease [Labrenzia sp. CE80]|uniref:TRAP transporter large permease n=1 Tax=Labrenzia sp. CE80 TaxID=1788986 RepID=UPI00129A7706|nr:TRAP transporter large permease [Labrenzia sp. CE80]